MCLQRNGLLRIHRDRQSKSQKAAEALNTVLLLFVEIENECGYVCTLVDHVLEAQLDGDVPHHAQLRDIRVPERTKLLMWSESGLAECRTAENENRRDWPTRGQSRKLCSCEPSKKAVGAPPQATS